MSERRDPYRICVESTSVGAVITALDGTILSADACFAGLAGTACTDLIGAPFERYVCPEDRDLFTALLCNGKTDRIRSEIRFCPNGGGPVPVYLSISPCCPGDAAGLSIVVSDLSGQKRLGGLLGSEGLAQLILEQAADPIVVLGPDGRILLANRAAHGLAGRNPLLLHFDEVFSPRPEHGAVAARFQGGLFETLVASAPETHELRCRAGSGASTLLVNAVPVQGSDDGPTGYVICLIDTSAREEHERRLRKALEDAASSNRELQQFAYAASHDLQEPLRMITSYLQLLERRYRDRLDDEAHEFIGFAVDGASRMQEQINDLLAYSRVTSRGKPPSPVDARDALAEALSGLEKKRGDTGAEISAGPLPVVMADPTQLVQVFQNLIDNALTFRSEAPPRIRVEAVRDEGGVRFSVRDNGIGIAPEFHERIFQMFQRLHTRDRYPGTGIGLAIVQRIVDRHGGRCWVESAEGEGSTFFFTIPDVPGRPEA